MESLASNENEIVPITGLVIDDSTLDEIESLIVELQNDNYASPIAQQLLTLEGEIVVWQYRHELEGGSDVL
jgi:hypothetical protein